MGRGKSNSEQNKGNKNEMEVLGAEEIAGESETVMTTKYMLTWANVGAPRSELELLAERSNY